MEQHREVPFIRLTGSPRERGLAHGKAAKELIEKNIAFYKRLLKLDDAVLLEQAKKLAGVIGTFRPEFIQEMDGIAEGAGVEPGYVYMINARTELLALGDTVQSECATFYFPQTSLLFENWDWSEPSKELTVLLHITLPTGATILTFTEAGMLGKVGMSSAGFGVAFNYLYPNGALNGLPIHALLRAILECSSYDEALNLLKNTDLTGTSGNILLANAQGQATNFELSGTSATPIPTTGKFFAHTNHYIGGVENDPEAGAGFLHNSFERYTRTQEVLGNLSSFNVAEAEQVLTERGAGDGMLCRDFIPEEAGHTMGTGTIASIVMDLPNKTMHLALDPQHSKEFTQYQL